MEGLQARLEPRKRGRTEEPPDSEFESSSTRLAATRDHETPEHHPERQCPGNAANTELVCFGAICKIPAQLRSDPAMLLEAYTDQKAKVRVQLGFHKDRYWLQAPNKDEFALISLRFSKALKRLDRLSCVDTDMVVASSQLKTAVKAWKTGGKLPIFHIEANIYGHYHQAEDVGNILISCNIFLQTPQTDFRNMRLHNPQQLSLPGELPLETNCSDPEEPQATEGSTTSIIGTRFQTFMDEIPPPTWLQQASIDSRLCTQPLKHQREAMDFIIRRELDNLPSQLSLWTLTTTKAGQLVYKHKITGSVRATREDVPGGMLADDVGLGKTLSMLSVIVGSLERAGRFELSRAQVISQSMEDTLASKATLVVVPSALLMDGWVDEIQRHVSPGALKWHKYHGYGKRISRDALSKNDIVLTTYATVAAAFSRDRSIIHEIEWYRILLDEAHMIRNVSTQQFRSVNSLRGYLRWCLTATPIQNSLEDLAALIKFLKVPLLKEVTTFRRHIIIPVMTKRQDPFASLRQLLETLCLRRTQKLLKLPEPTIRTHVLKLSNEEVNLHHDLWEQYRVAIDRAESGRSTKRLNQLMLEALLRMRLVCNNGEASLNEQQFPIGFPSDPDEALSYLQTRGEAACNICHCEVLSVRQADDPNSAFLTKCHHLLCSECVESYTTDLEHSYSDGSAQCPICGRYGRTESFLLRGKGAEQPMTATRSSDFPTKLLKLLSEIKEQGAEDKSIVFSFWKTSLDLISAMLEEENIPYYRIDGSLRITQRREILTNFQLSRGVSVLLMTLGTGAVGLNKLIVANRIHILEPQWNPSVESQAIGRVVRLGQQRTVTIVRYIMEETVEKAVQSLQLQKLKLARGGFCTSKDGDIEERVNEIKRLLYPPRR